MVQDLVVLWLDTFLTSKVGVHDVYGLLRAASEIEFLHQFVELLIIFVSVRVDVVDIFSVV